MSAGGKSFPSPLSQRNPTILKVLQPCRRRDLRPPRRRCDSPQGGRRDRRQASLRHTSAQRPRASACSETSDLSDRRFRLFSADLHQLPPISTVLGYLPPPILQGPVQTNSKARPDVLALCGRAIESPS
ncbi:hypothetical protein LXL04_021993 [Taraxacum kok-saghyz]